MTYRYNEFPPDRIEKIRSALINAFYNSEVMAGGRFKQYWRDDADSCILPNPGVVASDTRNRAVEAINSLVRLTGEQYVYLGPLTAREEAFAACAEAAERESAVFAASNGAMTAELLELREQNAALREAIEKAPHGVECKSRSFVNDTPYDEFKNPVCRSIGGCGMCEKCEWKKTRQPARRFDCNCWKSRALADLQTAPERAGA